MNTFITVILIQLLLIISIVHAGLPSFSGVRAFESCEFDCSGGACSYEDCVDVACPGGACYFLNCIKPSCAG